MLIQPLIQQLHELRLRGMACTLEQQGANADTGRHSRLKSVWDW